MTKNEKNKVCSCCGHPQRWSNVHVVEAVPLVKECVVGRTVETVKTAATLQLLSKKLDKLRLGRPEVYTTLTIH